VGDLIGRKYTFLVTMTLMGLCTFAVGLLPTAEQIGPAAGIILILLRILQGLALGGEYGGAATYVAEHAPQNRRGYFTSWIQITATLGLFISLGVILATRTILGEEAFGTFGWRVPFLISIFLVGLSIYIRYSLRESPLYVKLKEKKQISVNPLKESFGNPLNLSYVILALFGATMGQGVVWYTGQFYALFYLQKIYGVSLVDSNLIIGASLLVGTPFFILVGHLSDKYGRKPFMLWGMVLAVFTWLPIYKAMANFAPFIGNPADNVVNPGYSPFMLGVLVLIQVLYVTLVYGPIAAFLVELFPTKIRYTSMSLPYHIGNGVFGGLVPIIGLSLIQATGNNYAGLWYPTAVAAICAVIGFWKLPETNHVDIASDHSIASIRNKGVAASGRRILVPLDGSVVSETILDHARKLAKADGAELVLLQVANSAGEIFNDPSIAADDLNAVASADKSYMETLLARMKSEGVLASVEVREGPVAETILSVANEMNVDMIAMSTHGRSGLQKLLMGSITEWMIQHSHVPVLVLRPQDS